MNESDVPKPCHPAVGETASGPYARGRFSYPGLVGTALGVAIGVVAELGAALLNELVALRGELNNVADSIDNLAGIVARAHETKGDPPHGEH